MDESAEASLHILAMHEDAFITHLIQSFSRHQHGHLCGLFVMQLQEATISALRKSSRRISSGKKRSRNSYHAVSPRSAPATPRNHSSSSSGAAAAALQSLANAQLPAHDQSSAAAAAASGRSRQQQGTSAALDAALAAAAAAAAGISTSTSAAAAAGSSGYSDRESVRSGRSGSRSVKGDLNGLGVLAGGVLKHKVRRWL